MLAFCLLGEECRTTLCDGEWITQVVRDDTCKLVEALVLPTQLSLPFDAFSHVSCDPNEASYLIIGDYWRKFRLPEARTLADIARFITAHDTDP